MFRDDESVGSYPASSSFGILTRDSGDTVVVVVHSNSICSVAVSNAVQVLVEIETHSSKLTSSVYLKVGFGR